jgi:transcriptional regulator with XRE-family HTH domain
MARNKELGPDPIDVYVGDRVRARRKKQGFTQDELGDAVGVSFQQIQKYESGMNRISASKLYKMAKLLKVLEIDYFFKGYSEAEPIVGDCAALLELPETLEMLQAYYSTKDPRKRKKILSMCHIMGDRKDI